LKMSEFFISRRVSSPFQGGMSVAPQDHAVILGGAK